eukprot:2030286-Pleurochrysis_carterae.AAC.1
MLLSIRLLAIAFAFSTRMSAYFTGAPEVDDEYAGLELAEVECRTERLHSSHVSAAILSRGVVKLDR